MIAQRDIKAVLFDLDGTLLDTAPDLIACANLLLQENQRAILPPGMYASVVSHGSAAIIQRSFNLPPGDPWIETLRERFLNLYREHVSRRTQPFVGMLELIGDLESRGVIWGVVTNKPAWLTNPLLRDLSLHKRAACIVSGDTLPYRKPHPAPVLHACETLGIAPDETMLVGDALRDVQAGKAAGLLTLIALFGYISGEDDPYRWGADGLLGHPSELLRWLSPQGQLHQSFCPLPPQQASVG